MVSELKSRVSSLQNELDNSEKVQKDFVLLSQSLQRELEKIREAETEVFMKRILIIVNFGLVYYLITYIVMQVRWEHDEDALECRRCKSNFSVTRKKVIVCTHNLRLGYLLSLLHVFFCFFFSVAL